MSSTARCTCQRCAIRGLMGPVVVTTIGVLFLLSEVVRGGYLHIGRTFPVLLIVIGVVLLASAVAPMEGHIENPGAPAPPVNPTQPAPPPTYSNPYSGPGQ